MSLINLAGVVQSLASGTYTVTRRGATTYDAAGLVVAPTTSTLSAKGSMQPASGRDLQRLPEGSRARESRVFYTDTLLYTGTPDHEADRVAADGFVWEVGNCEAWGDLGNYYKAVLLKVGRF